MISAVSGELLGLVMGDENENATFNTKVSWVVSDIRELTVLSMKVIYVCIQKPPAKSTIIEPGNTFSYAAKDAILYALGGQLIAYLHQLLILCSFDYNAGTNLILNPLH